MSARGQFARMSAKHEGKTPASCGRDAGLPRSFKIDLSFTRGINK